MDKTSHQIEECRLAATGAPDQSRRLARLNFKVDFFDRVWMSTAVSMSNIFNFNMPTASSCHDVFPMRCSNVTCVSTIPAKSQILVEALSFGRDRIHCCMENPTVLASSVVLEKINANCARPRNNREPATETERVSRTSRRLSGLSLSTTGPPDSFANGIRSPLPDEGIMNKLAVI